MNAPAEPTPPQQSAARLTAWALHELPDATREEFEAALKADPARRAEAEGVREFCRMLEHGLQTRIPESARPLSSVVRQQLETAARQEAPRRVSLWMPSLAAAACFAVMLGVFSQSRRPQPAGGLIARNTLASSLDPSAHEAEIQRIFRMGLGYYDLGDYGQAEQQFNHVLALDPTNTAARRTLEKVDREVNNYYRAGRDHTRIRMLQGVDSLWETPIPNQPSSSTNANGLSPWGEELTYQAGRSVSPGSNQWTYREFDPPGLPVSAPQPEESAPTGSLIAQNTSPLSPGTVGVLTKTGRPVEVDYGTHFSSNPDAAQNPGDAFQFSVKYHFGNTGEANVPPSVESFRALPENPFLSAIEQPLSTFSIDVDTASYAIVRRHLNEGQRPPAAAVRLEELINYFPMDDAPPGDGRPFSVQVETASAPWAAAHRLVRVALKGRSLPVTERAPANLVFLVDTSGSMNQPEKLPLVQQSLQLLLARLEPRDRVALVTYAGESRVVLPSTLLSERAAIAAAIDSLSSGGSTNGSGGISAAYQVARANFLPGGVNRVILATDGDFNVGVTSEAELKSLITSEAKSGVYLSVLGYGSDNLKDTTAELLADQGNGNYAYIDSLSEARRALVSQLEGTMVTIAKDVKIQVEFNPATVSSYRLLGYENRALANKDFNDDTKDAGEIGAGHSVTALYEIVPAGAAAPGVATVDPLKYQSPTVPGSSPNEVMGEVKVAFVESPLEDVLEEYQRLANRFIIRDLSLIGTVTVVQPPGSKFNAAQAAAFIKTSLFAQGFRIQEYRPAGSTDHGIDKVVVANPAASGELLTVKLRYQLPEGTAPSQLIEVAVKDPGAAWPQASPNFRWTAAVAGYGLLLRGSTHAGDLTWETVRSLASGAKGPDPDGFRGEFLQLVEKAAGLAPAQ